MFVYLPVALAVIASKDHAKVGQHNDLTRIFRHLTWQNQVLQSFASECACCNAAHFRIPQCGLSVVAPKPGRELDVCRRNVRFIIYKKEEECEEDVKIKNSVVGYKQTEHQSDVMELDS